MPRITGSNHGESRLRMLRVVRRGDRHDPKDLTVSCRFEGAADASLEEPAGATVPRGGGQEPGARAPRARPAHGEIEPFGARHLRSVCSRRSSDQAWRASRSRSSLVAARHRRQGAGAGIQAGGARAADHRA